MRPIALVCILGVVLAACAAAGDDAPAPSTRVVLVRHAEKETDGADPALTERGRRRAAALARMLEDAGVTKVFATPFRRTQETARPLADRAGVEVETVAVGPDHPGSVAEALRSLPAGSVAVVVGHSNTIPEIIAALGAGPAPSIPEDRYGDLFVVELRGGEAGPPLRLRFDPTSPP